jgi:hypothetical protein
MPAGEDVSVSGMVQSGDGAPIHTIKVTIYREDREVAHAFTSEDGKYVMSVAKGKPITVRFDTHFSLNNAKDWHPSVVANVSAMKDVAVDRVLLRVGHGDGFTAFIDALSGYEFGAFCEDRDPNQAYAQSAAERLGPMKLPISILQEFQRKLAEHFRERARGP